jgi:hypothetical protein
MRRQHAIRPKASFDCNYTGGGRTREMTKEPLKREEAACGGRSIGEHTIDLRAEIVVERLRTPGLSRK